MNDAPIQLPRRPLRITFVLAAVDVSGGVRVICTYVEHLRKMGHKVTIVSRPPMPITLRNRVHNLIYRTKPSGAQREWPVMFDALKSDHHKIESYRDIRADDVPDADVIVATWWETTDWVSRFPASKGAKVCFAQGYEIDNPATSEKLKATWRLPFRRIVIARWLQDLAKKEYGITDAALVPNAVDHTLFHAPERNKQSQPTVGLLYTKVECKGCDIALAGIALAKEKNPNLQLVTFGHRPSEPPLVLPDYARHTIEPAQSKIRELYASCDAWILTSRSEGFGLPILESMACRTPVIATPFGAAPELIEQGGGVLIPHNDPPSLCREILRITSLSESEWKSLSDQAYRTASRYTWQEAAALFEQVMLHEAAKVR